MEHKGKDKGNGGKESQSGEKQEETQIKWKELRMERINKGWQDKREVLRIKVLKSEEL